MALSPGIPIRSSLASGSESFQDTLSICTLRPRLCDEAFQILLLYIYNFIFSLGKGWGETEVLAEK